MRVEIGDHAQQQRFAGARAPTDGEAFART
jgi:hypothetical protein